MDFATLIGLIGCFGVIVAAILVGGSALLFINVPSFLIVVLGTAFATVAKVSFKDYFGSFKVGLNALFYKTNDPNALIETAVQLADMARKNGLLALEGQEIDNEFLKRGISLCVDGHDPDMIKKMLSSDINLAIERHDKGQDMFLGVADCAPAMGMIGTLVGLVQMLANMDDPKTIGPAMAVALLTTLYGAVIANSFCIPIAKKLAYRSDEERLNKQLILETIMGIQEGLNPRVLMEILKTYIPEKSRATEDKEE